MAEQTVRFICAYADCKKETTLIIQTAKPLPMRSKGVSRVYHCQHCDRANKVALPDNVDVHVFILGEEEGFPRYTDGEIPLLQGEKDL